MASIVNLVPSEPSGWIVGRIVDELAARNNWGVGPFDPRVDVNFFVTYYAATHARLHTRFDRTFTAGWFTHPEGPNFFSIARQLDVRLCQASKYATQIDGFVVAPGVDPIFRPRLRLGVVGRTYKSGRKGEALLAEIRKEGFVDLLTPKCPNASQKAYLECLRDFYTSIDALLVPSLVEGGPVPAAEATACGIPIIAPRGLGNIHALEPLYYEQGDVASLRKTLTDFYETMNRRSKLVETWTWARFADECGMIIDSEFLRKRGR